MTESDDTPEIRHLIRTYFRKNGAVVTSIGLEDFAGGCRYSVGISRGLERLSAHSFDVQGYPVHVFSGAMGSH